MVSKCFNNWATKVVKDRTPHASARGQDDGPMVGPWHSTITLPFDVQSNHPKHVV